MTDPPLTGLALVRDQLAEARRHTHTDPAAAKSPLMHATLDLTVDELWKDTRHAALVRRIAENLLIGAGCISAAPDVTDAYITGALWELGDLASRLRKDAEAEGRDRELMEGYGPKGETDLLEAIEEVRAAGADAWDRIEDPAAFLGRDEIPPGDAV